LMGQLEVDEPLPPEIIRWLGFRRFSPKAGEYHVSTLVGCLGCAYDGYSADRSLTPAELWKMKRGTLLHGVTYAFQWRELDMSHEFDFEGSKLVIRAHLDAYSPERATAYEFKTTNFLEWQMKNSMVPRKTHVLQLQSYGRLFEKTIPIAKLRLVYFDMTSFQSFTVERKDTLDWLVTRAKALHQALATRTSPAHEDGCFALAGRGAT
jgi:hypothetical protein